ncbi:hypothetical protein D9615_002262 [Tricholomella constricta]|uniref:Uncharacterized protein n=1 Tax=Tricholomella constricta TaxID=117010 RepID=A0A8H5HMK1_9AGAR|nr:hypothetical protein D9615_002262 [Tricholomella constricta]
MPTLVLSGSEPHSRMHFSIRKTFSRLHAHRRTVSEAFPVDFVTQPVAAQVHRPSSMTNLEGLLDLAYAPPGPASLRTSPESALLVPKTVLKASKPPSISTPALPDHISSDITRLERLETENRCLRERVEYLKLEVQVREEELNRFRSDYYAERFKANVRKRLAKSSENCHEVQLEQADKFISSMVEAGLHQRVLSEAWTTIAAGATADDALVDAIKKAAATPGTSWSRIIPNVVGPWTPDNYLAAIDMAVNVTKELKNANKFAKFWKTRVRQDSGLKELSTPSPSDLSDTSVMNDLLGHDELVVDDLLQQLQSGGFQPRIDVAHPVAVPGQTLIATPGCACVHVPVTPHHDARNRALAPLASQGLKDEIMLPTSPGKRSKLSPTKKLRSILKGIDINTESQPPLMAVEKQGTKSSAKALGKRKAILVERAQPGPTLVVRSSKEVFRGLHSMDNVPFDLDCPPLPSSLSSQSGTHLRGDSGILSAEKALQSLERICAGFSSGSLGSLDSISEVVATKDFRRVPYPAMEAVANDTHASRKSSAQPISPSFTHSIIKTSTPLASKSRQPRSLPKPSSFLANQFQPSTTLSTKPTLSPIRKTLRKHTSPLRIAKKARDL